MSENIYLTTEEMREAIEQEESLSIVKETEDYFLVSDGFNMDERLIQFNKEHFEINESIIETFGKDLSTFQIIEFLQELPKVLFMNIKKIFFVSSSKEVDLLEKKYSDVLVDTEYLGTNDWVNGTIVINLKAHEEVIAREMMLEILDDEKKEIGLREAVYTTIAQELYRSLQRNPLFEAEVEQGEVAAEEFSLQLLG